MSRPRKTYYPTVSFDDQLTALAALLVSKGWSFAGVEPAVLAQDATDQRNERAAHDALEATYRNAHEAFGEAQQKRFERFAAALAAARGAFRDDKAIQAELARFKRPTRRASAKNGAQEPPPA